MPATLRCPRMERFRVVGGARLAGAVRVTGAKNSVLKVMAAALLAEGRTTLTDVPHILDVEIMGELLRRLGCEVDYDPDTATVVIDVPGRARAPGRLRPGTPDPRLDLRARPADRPLRPRPRSRCPGGDAIGSRPLDFHIAGLTKLGAELDNEHGYIVARAPHGPDRCDRLAGLPERRRHRERADGRRARVGHHRHRQRGPRAGDRRPLPDAAADGRQDRRHRHLDPDHRGRRPALADHPRDRARTASSRAPGRSPRR